RATEPRLQPKSRVYRLGDRNLRDVLDYINQHIGADIPLEQLATLADVDIYHLIRSFTRSIGVSPHHYVIQRRIDISKDLLRRSKLPLSVIAHRCGFSTPSHYSSTFRRWTGVTPSSYRRGAS